MRKPNLNPLLFSASFCFWIFVILLLGAAGYLLMPPVSLEVQSLHTTFSIWDSTSPLRHGFLYYAFPGYFEQGLAYTHFTTIYLIFYYLFTRLLMCAGLSPEVSLNFTIFIYLLVIYSLASLALDQFRSHEGERQLSKVHKVISFFFLFLGCAVLVSVPSLWISSIAIQRENWTFLGAAAFAAISIFDEYAGLSSKRCFIMLALLVMFAPVFFPIVALTYFLFLNFESLKKATLSERQILVRTLILILLGIVFHELPELIRNIVGFKNVASSYLFRSGLDGDVRGFQSIAQAFLSPFRADVNRRWTLLAAPSVVLFLIFWTTFILSDREAGKKMMRQFCISLLPYAYLLLVFPQAVSIHPYIFDNAFLFAPAFCLFYWLQKSVYRSDLGAVSYLFLILITWGVALTQLLDIARFFK